MKKTFLLFLIAAFALSCEGPMGPPGRPGIDGPPGEEGNWSILNYEVISKDWDIKLNPDNGLHYYENVFPIEQLTDFVYDEGFVLGYFRGRESGKDVLYPLPYKIQMKDGNKKWTREISFKVLPGKVLFQILDEEFDKDRVLNDMDFRLVLRW